MSTCYLTHFLGMEYVVSKAELIPCKLLRWLKSATVPFKYFNDDFFLLVPGVDPVSSPGLTASCLACDIAKYCLLSIA